MTERRILEEFTISDAMVQHFADLTGDRNALHLDGEVARRFRFRQPVVHGMLPFSFIAALGEGFPGSVLEFSSFDVRFVAPVVSGAAVRLDAHAVPTPAGDFAFTAAWSGSAPGATLIQASGRFATREPSRDLSNTAGSAQTCLVTEPLSENTYTIDQLEGRSETVPFTVDGGALARFAERVFEPALGRALHLCPNLAATLLLSTLVGMRLPGRFATFVSCKVTFAGAVALGTPGQLRGSVEGVTPAGESASIRASILQRGEELAAARLKVLVNPAPKPTIGCEVIRQQHLEPGVRGKVAVVTGSSRGIGEATAKLLAMHGARTVVHYFRGRHDARVIVDDIRSAGGEAVALGCDIRDEREVERLFAQVLDVYGRVDILVNNAVNDFRPKPVLKLEWSEYLEELDVSLKGMHHCCRAAVSAFKRHGGGKIVNLSSVAVDNPVRGQNKYITAKGAVVAYTRSLAKELIGDNIQVNLVVPNTTETDLLSSIPSEWVRRIASDREYGRNLAPIEVAHAIVFLASSWADGMTGQQIVLNLGEPPFA
jgi:NAD(P)-dependent dehydrogenase (short-subunit alcohol dehydrogenase family)